ncbi:MAG: HAMP domain-containing protein [Rhodocyclales bacterium]|nr:HAMP domain-containing protein [Rhodocyclales bacterium]
MLSRRHPLQIRLLNAYKLLMGILLLLVWLIGIGHFYYWERGEIKQSTHVAATMLATQSSAALMFGDTQVLRENLASLKDLEGLRWSAIVPTRTNVPVPVISEGDVPDDIQRLIDRLGKETERMSLMELIVRAPIMHVGIERGQLLVAVDLQDEIKGFLKVAAVTLLLMATVFQLGQLLFRRIIQSIVAPLDDLLQVVVTVADQVRMDRPLDKLQRPATDFSDEVGQLAGAFNLMLDSIIRHDDLMRDQATRLAQLVEDLRSLSARMRAVREEERTRISHEIHDELGQRLTALKFEVARMAGGDEGNRIGGQIDELIRTVRVISWELRPSVLDSLGLVAAMEWQAQDFSRRLGIRCSVDLPEDELHIPSEMATDLFRVFQELLTNISRHAQATRVDIILETTGEAIYLDVKDDGRGLHLRDQSRPSLGLLGIRERLDRWGGIIDIDAANSDADPPGTRIHIKIPLGKQGTFSELEQAP